MTTPATRTLKALETVYKGVHFRSRLEARWAVFFDSIGIVWEYEPEGFKLPSGACYMPDFWLAKIETWVEIKPSEPTQAEGDKCHELAEASGHRVICFYGRPGWWLDDNGGGGQLFTGAGWGWGWDCDYQPCVCTVCGKPGIEYLGRSERICNHPGEDGKRYSSDDDRVTSAVFVARTKRFWSPGSPHDLRRGSPPGDSLRGP